MARDPWEDYFWPDTKVLQNKLGERDASALWRSEYQYSQLRQGEIDRGEVLIPRTYDSAHLKAIHGHLFQDVYDWAGQYRTVNMHKDRLPFADIRQIDEILDTSSNMIGRIDWNGLNREQFVQASAHVFAQVNYAHPFREGNGRASIVFMSHVAERSRFVLDFDRLADPQQREAWNDASGRSRSRGPGRPLDPTPLQPVFARLAQPRHEGADPAVLDAQTLKARQLLDSTYGKPADAAARLNPHHGGTADPAARPRPPSHPHHTPPTPER
jgi:cell filamentation protein